MRLRRGPFDELVERQLSLFVDDERELLLEADEAESAWIRSDRESAEEAYGDFQLVVDAIADRLVEVRDTYARTLDEDTAEKYVEAFDRAAARRFPRLAAAVRRS